MVQPLLFFLSPPFLLLSLSFSPFLFLRYHDFGAFRTQETCLLTLFHSNDCKNFVRLVFKKSARFLKIKKSWPRHGPPPPPSFWKKNITLRNTHFQIKGIFDGIRVLDWRSLPMHPNLWLVHFDPISHGKPQNAYLYKTALSRIVDFCVFTSRVM